MVKLAMSLGIGRCNRLSLRPRTVEPLVSRFNLMEIMFNNWMHINIHNVLNLDVAGWLIVVWDLRRAKPVIRYRIHALRVLFVSSGYLE